MSTVTTNAPICYPGYTPGLAQSPFLRSSEAPSLLQSPSLSVGDLGELNPSNSSPFATSLTNSQGFTALAALGPRPSNGPGAVDYASEGVTAADHANRTVDAVRRAATSTRGVSRAGVAGAAALEQTSGLTKGLRIADGVLGPLGVVAGGYSIASGISEIQDGKVVDGSLSVLGGGAGIVSGGAATTSAIMGAAAPAVVGALAAGGAGVAAAADGVRDIYQGVRDGNTEQAVTGGVKTVAGGLLIGGAATANPIAIGAGAVLYGGAVIYENREAIANGARAVGGAVVDGAVAVGGAIADGASAVGGAVVDGAVAVGGAIADGASAVGGAISDGASAVGGAISGGASAIGNGVSGLWNWATGS